MTCTLALPPICDTLIEGFSHFVTSMTAPIASGWSGCRMGFAPIGKRRLCTAHTQLGHRFVQAATAWRAAVSHSSIEIPAANTAIARCSAGFRSAHEILFIACPRDGFRLFFEILPYYYSHAVSDRLSVEGFSHFVTSMAAPIASGWSGCRVGFT